MTITTNPDKIAIIKRLVEDKLITFDEMLTLLKDGDTIKDVIPTTVPATWPGVWPGVFPTPIQYDHDKYPIRNPFEVTCKTLTEKIDNNTSSSWVFNPKEGNLYTYTDKDGKKTQFKVVEPNT